MTVRDEHRKEDVIRPCLVLVELLHHVFDGTVSEGALALVLDTSEVSDEVLSGCELAEDKLILGEVLASEGPYDPDLALVLLISQILGKDRGELLNFVHKLSWWGLM